MKDENKNIQEAFDDLGKDLVKTLIKKLLEADKKATGNLIRSIEYKVVVGKAQDIMVDILAAPYLTEVDEGRKPGKKDSKGIWRSSKDKGFPTKALDKWVVARGLAPRNKKGKFVSRAGMKFAIGQKINRDGIKATNVIQKTIDEVYKTKQQLIQKAAIEDINAMVDKLLVNDRQLSEILKK